MRYHVGLDSNIGWQRETPLDRMEQNKQDCSTEGSGTMDFNNYSDVRYVTVKVCFLQWCTENINIHPNFMWLIYSLDRQEE